MTYTLWCTDSGNAIGFYDTVEDALKDVQATVEAYDSSDDPHLLAMALVSESGDPRMALVAEGKALVALARSQNQGVEA